MSDKPDCTGYVCQLRVERGDAPRIAEPLHPCPYQEEINDNDDDYCTCCDDCRQECVWDI